ncbi:MAG: ATP-binding protein [Phototrophicaceae bacterium]|jgi:serine/threonine-protein kinase RsbW
MSDVIYLRLPASHRFLNVVGATIRAVLTRVEMPHAETFSYNVELAVHEICANIVDHAYENVFDASFDAQFILDEERLSIILIDQGRSFDPNKIPPPDLNDVHTGGYGLFLAKELLDEVTYQATQEGNRWILVKRLHS